MIVITTNQGQTIDANFLQFSGGERHVQLGEIPRACEPHLNITAFIRSSNDLIDLLLSKNALDQHFATPVKVNLEIPYLPYARQDRVCASGQAFSLQVMAALIMEFAPAALITWDCHSEVGLNLSGARNIEPASIIKASSSLVEQLQDANSVLVCPDKGAIQRCEAIKTEFGVSTLVRCEKHRDPSTGSITNTEVMAGDLAGKVAIITDDICDGGFTFIKIAEQLRKKQAVKVVLYVTHGIFSKGFDVFDGLIDEIYCTNSFLHKPNPKLKTIEFSSNTGR